MKILFVAPTVNDQSGWGRYAKDLISALSKLGVGTQVLLPGVLSRADSSLLNPKSLVRNWFQINRYAKNYDLIHFLGEEPYPASMIFKAMKPFIMTVYGTYAVSALNRTFLERFIYQTIYKKAKKIITISKFTKEKLAEKNISENVDLIYPGVNLDDFKKSHKNDRKFRIISVGGLTPRKGYEISLAAVSSFYKDVSKDIEYVIVAGNRNSEKNIKYFNSLISKYGLSKIVKLKLNLSTSELVNEYNQADIFLLTPIHIGPAFEGFGLVYLEAAACGLPCIGSNSGGASEAIRNGVSGITVEEGNVNETLSALKKLFESPQTRIQMSKNSKTWAKKFSWNGIAKKYLKTYENCLSL